MADQPLVEVPLVYSNALRVGITFTEIRLYFGESVPPPPPPDLQVGQLVQAVGQMKQIDRLCIAMTPDVMPAVIDGLQRAIQAYQNQFGALRQPPQQTPQSTAQQ